MICPYKKELIINDQGGYKEVFNLCVEEECPYYTSLLTCCCWKVQIEIDTYHERRWLNETDKR